MFGYIFNWPSATYTLSAIGEWTVPILSDFKPVLFLLVGIPVAFFFVKFLWGILTGASIDGEKEYLGLKRANRRIAKLHKENEDLLK